MKKRYLVVLRIGVGASSERDEYIIRAGSRLDAKEIALREARRWHPGLCIVIVGADPQE